MSTMEQREDIVRQDGLLVGIAGLSLLCGMHFSPYFDPAFILVKFFGPAFFVGSPLIWLAGCLPLPLPALFGASRASRVPGSRAAREPTIRQA